MAVTSATKRRLSKATFAMVMSGGWFFLIFHAEFFFPSANSLGERLILLAGTLLIGVGVTLIFFAYVDRNVWRWPHDR